MISVIIPVYNEEDSIKDVIDEIKRVLKENHLDKGSEIIAINDGSVDHTQSVLEKCKVTVLKNPQNMGYGFSLKRGIEIAKNETIVITDGDGTYPFSYVPKLLEKKREGYDLVVGARTGKYYHQSFFKRFLRKILKIIVEFTSGKKIKDINSGLRVFDKSTVMKYFSRICNTFSFTTSQTLTYLMNCHFVTYVDIPYQKRSGKSKIKLFRDSLIVLKYILEICVYYNPFKVFNLLTCICLLLSMIGFIFSHFFNIHAGYILGIGGILVSIVVFCIGLLAVLLKQIMDK